MAYRAMLAPGQLRRPILSRGIVARDTLRKLLRAGDAHQRRVLIASAGAGWGKSTLLAQRAADLEDDGVPVGWVSVDEGMSSMQLWSAVLTSLERAHRAGRVEVANQLQQLALPSAATVDDFVASLSGVLDNAGPTAIVLDGLEHASPESLDILGRSIGAGGQDFRVLLGTRWDLPLPVGRWQAQGLAQEVRGTDLAFDLEETRLLLAASHVRLDDDLLIQLYELTEGWPVALSVATSALQHGVEPELFLRQFTAATRPMADYLVSELFSDLPLDVAEFMLDISAPDEVTEDLALAITSRADAGALLAGWAASSAMVAEFGEGPLGYRFHSLLRGYLRAEARRRDLPRVRRTHAVTAGWFAHNHDSGRALAHGVASQDWPLVRRLLDKFGLSLLMTGGTHLVANVLDALPAEDEDDLLAARLRATAAALSGDAPSLGVHLRTLRTAVVDGQEHLGEWTSVLTLVADRLAGDRPADLRERLARRGLATIVEPDLRLLAANVRGSWWIELNDFDRAETDLQEALRAATGHKRDYLALDCHSRLCLVAAAGGDFSVTRARCDETISWAAGRGFVHQASLIPVYLMRAWVAWDGLEPDTARRYLDQARTSGGGVDPQVTAATTVLTANLDLITSGNRGEYRQALARCWADIDPSVVAPVALSAYLAQELAVALAAADVSWAQDILSRAELLPAGSGDIEVFSAMLAVHRGELGAARLHLARFEQRGTYPVAATIGHLLSAVTAKRSGRHAATGHHLRAALRIVRRRLCYRPFSYVPGNVAALLRSRIGTLGELDPVAADVLRALEAAPAEPTATLTDRERAVLALLAGQMSVKEVATELGVSPNTIKVYVRSVYAKLQVHRRADAVTQARLQGLLL